VRERRLPEARRAIEQQVIERLVALLRGLDCDLEVVLQLLLPDELPQLPRPQRCIKRRVVVLRFG
jgi:hypothetical protein